jgi:CheY-like chemotaxis protein
VRELRALSRSDEVSKGPIDLEPVLASCLKMVGNELRHRARVLTSIPPGLPLVDANASRLGQVFLNLLVNAAHAIPEGRGDSATIRVRAYAEAGNVIVEVADTGVGIASHVIGRIFDPFFTTKPIGQGTGLGLPISHEIVRSLGGSIDVESTPGTGSTFRVVLPVVPGAVAPRRRSTSRQPPLEKLTGLRVLVADDEPTVRLTVQRMLERRGAIAVLASDGAEAEQLINAQKFDVVLLDVMMPRRTGYQLVTIARAVQPETPVILMSGYTDQVHGVEPPDFFLEKPFNATMLESAIQSALRNGH